MAELDRLLDELICGDEARSEASARRIATLGTDAIPDLEKLLACNDSDHRWWAMRALAEIPSEKSIELLITGLNDKELTVRQCAALGIRLNPDERAIPGLIKALEESDHLMRSLAADALITVGKPAVPELIEVVNNKSQPARLEAIRALALIGDKRCIPALFTALDEDSALMQHWAEEGLERMGVGMMFFEP